MSGWRLEKREESWMMSLEGGWGDPYICVPAGGDAGRKELCSSQEVGRWPRSIGKARHKVVSSTRTP
jgi:hypothetical protein